jgi:nucleoid-associated protein YgaU
MFLKGSRYNQSRYYQSAGPFRGVRPREINAAQGVVEHVINAGDRLDLLAWRYYKDTRLWWRILDANPEIVFGGSLLLDEMQGQVILIPKARG